MLKILYSKKEDGFMNFQEEHDDWNYLANKHIDTFLEKNGLGSNKLIIAHLDHRNMVLAVNENSHRYSNYEKTDALYTNVKDIVLAVGMADCFPVVIYDPQSYKLSIVHCGWKSILGGVLENTIRAMEPISSGAYVYIGPGICKNCYQFNDDPYSIFPAKHIDCNYVDLRGIIVDRLSHMGLSDMHIQDSCTKENLGLFSARRDRYDTGKISVDNRKILTPLETGMCFAIMQ